MNNITIIIPIVNYKENEDIIKRALNSISNFDGKILMVYGNNDKLDIEKCEFSENVLLLNNKGETDFCSQINYAVSKCDSEFFSILEMDDEYSDIWFKNVELYINKMPDVDILMPIVELIDYNDSDNIISFTNEIAWANAFTNEIGYIDFDCLENYYDFNLTGGVFRKSEFEKIGGLKKSIKVSFMYEFMLRATSKGLKLYVVPKIGYYHYIGRDKSISETYKKCITEDEAKGWYDLAKIEYSYKEDRNKTPIKLSDEITELK